MNVAFSRLFKQSETTHKLVSHVGISLLNFQKIQDLKSKNKSVFAEKTPEIHPGDSVIEIDVHNKNPEKEKFLKFSKCFNWFIKNIPEIEKKRKILQRDSIHFPYHKIMKSLETSEIHTKDKCFDDPSLYLSLLKNSEIELEKSDSEKLRKCQTQINIVSTRLLDYFVSSKFDLKYD